MQRLLDTFTGVNGTAIAAHAPNVGGPWTSVAPGFTIQSNKLVADPAAQATAPFLRNWGRVDLTFDLGTFGEADVLTFGIGNAVGDNAIQAEIQDQSVILAVYQASELVCTAALRALALNALGNIASLQVGPGFVQLTINGVFIGKIPRVFTNGYVLDAVLLDWLSAGATSPLIRKIAASGLGWNND